MRAFRPLAILAGVYAATGLAVWLILGGADVTSDTEKGVVLHRGLGDDPETLDPALSSSLYASEVQNDLFEGLTILDAQDRPHPAVAESWTVSSDGLVYIFKLRPGLVWSDGSPLTADDFVYAFRRAVDPATASDYAYLYYPLRNGADIITGRLKDVTQLGVEAPDPLTLKVTLNRPTPYFPALLGHTNFFPVNRANVEKYGRAFTHPGNLVSDGAFTLAEWTPHSRIVVVKNQRYWNAAHVQLDKVIFYSIDSAAEQFTRYRAGELDITDFTAGVPVNDIDFIRDRLGPELHSTPAFSLDYLGFNVTKPPFAGNPKLRQALSMVIDREAIETKLVRIGEPIAYGAVPAAGAPGYTQQRVAWADWPMAKRIAYARQLYREAGYGPEHPLTVEYRYGSGSPGREEVAILSMWQETLGIRAKLIGEEFRVLMQDRISKQVTQVFDDAWIGDYPDPTTFLDLFVSTTGENDPGYHNPRYDELIATAERTADIARRNDLLKQAEGVLLADNAIAPLFDSLNLYLAKPYIRGFTPNPCGYVFSKDVTVLAH